MQWVEEKWAAYEKYLEAEQTYLFYIWVQKRLPRSSKEEKRREAGIGYGHLGERTETLFKTPREELCIAKEESLTTQLASSEEVD